MTERERFLRTMRFEAVDRPPIMACSPWVDTVARWQREGLPEGTTVEAHLGLPALQTLYLGPETGVFPRFEERTLEEGDTWRVFVDRNGITNRRLKNSSAMPEYVDYPIQDARTLEAFMEERFSLDTMADRYPEDWEARMARAADPDRAVATFVDGGNIYGWLRRLAGVETCSLLFYEAPELVDRFFERVHAIAMHGLERVLARVSADHVGWGEDIAFKTSTLISPDMFRRFLLPRYKASTSIATAHGVDVIWYDSDGNLYPFLDLYLEAGITGLAPMEVAAGMDPVELRRHYGKAFRMFGGLDKRILAGPREGITAEVERLRPVIAQGGYIPGCDHHVPPDVSLGNYCWFVEKLMMAYGAA